MSLQHDYRPQSLNEFFGNESAIESLRVVLNRESEKIPKAYLLVGPAGCGKTTLAYIIRDMLECTTGGFHEFDASSDRGIDKIRRIKRDAILRPLDGKLTVMLFDECHGVTGPAQEAMLKLLENPPPHVYLILATTEPEKLKSTIIRRCHQFHVKPLLRFQMMELLSQIYEAENKKVSKKILSKIHRVCWGSPGQAVKLLDQIIDIEKEAKALEAIESITYEEVAVKEMCKLLMNENLKGLDKWNRMRALLSNFNGDPESTRRAILTYLGKVLTGDNWNANVANVMALFVDSFIYTGIAGLILACYYAVQDSSKEQF